jgi:hypothetical protein
MEVVVEKLRNRSLRSPKGCGNLLPTLVEKTKPIILRAKVIRQKAKGIRNFMLLCPCALFAKQSQFSSGVN